MDVTARQPDPHPLRALCHLLREHYGPSGWWPAESPFEVMVGAVLTQNTAWTNVEKAILNLRQAGLLEPQALHRAEQEHVAALIRPSGYYNLKTGRLKNLVDLVIDSGGLAALFEHDTLSLRTLLLQVKGIGPETADSICLYAAHKPIFVIDAYTRRILSRHGLIDERWRYDDIRQLFEEVLPAEVGCYQDLHAHLVAICKDFCRSGKPRCEECVLRAWPVP